MREIKGCLRKIEGYFYEGNIWLNSRNFLGRLRDIFEEFFLGKLRDIFEKIFEGN